MDVALRTSAAPTYFPIYQGFVDGGVVANNPSLCAITQAISQSHSPNQVNHSHLLSVGIGLNLDYLEVKENKTSWGYVQWLPHLVDLLIEGGVDLVHYQCQKLLGDNYLRLNLVIHRPIRLDDVNQIDTLTTIAHHIDQNTWNNTVAWVRKNML